MTDRSDGWMSLAPTLGLGISSTHSLVTDCAFFSRRKVRLQFKPIADRTLMHFSFGAGFYGD